MQSQCFQRSQAFVNLTKCDGQDTNVSDLSNYSGATTAIDSTRGVIGADREHSAGADWHAGSEYLCVNSFETDKGAKQIKQ